MNNKGQNMNNKYLYFIVNGFIDEIKVRKCNRRTDWSVFEQFVAYFYSCVLGGS